MLLTILLFCNFHGYSQNLMSTPIRKMDGRKKGVYLDQSIVYGGKRGTTGSITAIRGSFNTKEQYERLVFDLSSKIPPYIYSYLKGNKLYIDFFELTLPKNFSNLGGGQLVKNIKFYTLDKGHLSAEVSFKENVKFDIFFLKDPVRLVVDIKK